MNVKGIVFVTSKVTITAAFGEERWNSFMVKLAQKDKFFGNIIMSVTLIPMEKQIFFLEELIKEFFDNDKKQILKFGAVAAKFSLSPGGAYNSYLLSKDLKQFIEFALPKLWSTYYDEGVLTGHLENDVVHIKITDVPIKHVFIEYLNVGYVQKALKIFGKETIEKCIRGFSKGDSDIYFQYELQNS